MFGFDAFETRERENMNGYLYGTEIFGDCTFTTRYCGYDDGKYVEYHEDEYLERLEELVNDALAGDSTYCDNILEYLEDDEIDRINSGDEDFYQQAIKEFITFAREEIPFNWDVKMNDEYEEDEE